jgi:hypothetical protein
MGMRVHRVIVVFVLALVVSTSPPLRPSASAQTIADKIKGLTSIPGFVPMYWDAATGKLFLEVTPGLEMIYVVSLPAGLGSNDIGLDRGQLSGERIVRFDRVGPKVLLTQPNLRYRAVSTTNPAEQRAIASPSPPALSGGQGRGQTDGRVLVDATDFALRDAHGVIGALQRGRAAPWTQRGCPHLPRTRAEPPELRGPHSAFR